MATATVFISREIGSLTFMAVLSWSHPQPGLDSGDTDASHRGGVYSVLDGLAEVVAARQPQRGVRGRKESPVRGVAVGPHRTERPPNAALVPLAGDAPAVAGAVHHGGGRSLTQFRGFELDGGNGGHLDSLGGGLVLLFLKYVRHPLPCQ